jgi:O-antigen/teichoic acid export membrane protein
MVKKSNKFHGIFKKYKKYLIDFFWISLHRLGTDGLTVLVFFLTARLLTPELFGQYNYLLALVSLFVIFGDFGLSTSTGKFVAEYRVKNKERIGRIIFSSLVVCFFLSLIVSVFVLIFGKILFASNYNFIFYLIPLIFLISSVSILNGIYRGLQEFKNLAIISLTSGLLALISAFFLISTYGIIGAILVQIFFYSISFILLIKSTKIHTSFDKEIANNILQYALIIGFAGLSYFLYTRVDIIILEHFGYIVEIGYYEIINKIFTFLILPFILFSQVIAPEVTKLMANENYIKIRGYIQKIAYIFLIGIGISIISYFLLPLIIKISLPEYFTDMLLIILIVLLMLLPFKVAGVFLTQGFVVPSGYAKITATITLIGGITNVIFDVLFIQIFGFIGVFYVTAIVHSAANIFTYIYFYRKISKRC